MRRKLAPGGDPRIVWEQEGDEVLLHLDALAVELHRGVVSVSLPLETDQTGRHELRTSFAVGVAAGDLFAVTDELPEGHDALVARWGQVVQDALWWALVELVEEQRAAVGDVSVAVDVSPDRVAWNWKPRRRSP